MSQILMFLFKYVNWRIDQFTNVNQVAPQWCWDDQSKHKPSLTMWYTADPTWTKDATFC